MMLIDGKKADSYQDFKEKTLDICASLASESRVEKLKVVLTDIKPPAVSVIPFSKDKVAVVSLYQTDLPIAESNIKLEGLRAAYQVTEALPVHYQKDWDDGSATPGINLLTLFRKKQNISYDQFIDRWHNGHTPLSLKLHPLWNYNRNVVGKSLLDVSTWYDGIVEEQVREKSELLNPFKFFGNPLVIIPNMLKVYIDVKGFIDYPSIETYLANEYWIKS